MSISTPRLHGGRRTVVAAALLGLVSAPLALGFAAPAQAVTGVFISELHYDNFGTDAGEFVEVTAPAGTDLSGYQVVLYNGNGGTTYDTDSLTTVVSDQADGWGTAVLDYPSNGLQNGAPDGVALVNGGTVVEFVSYEGGMTATAGPATGQAATDIGVAQDSAPVGETLQRQVDGTWTGPTANTKGMPNGHTVAGAPLAAQDQGDKTGMVDVPVTGFTLQATGGATPYTWGVLGLPDGLTATPEGDVSGTPTTAGVFDVTATVTDGDDATDQVTFTYTIEEAPDLTPIAEIQGTGARSPFAPESGNSSGTEVLTTQGVVTGLYTTGGLNGMYLQTPGTDTEGASDGIFVYGGFDAANIPAGIALGDSVAVTGKIAEFYDLTQIVPASSSAVTELDSPLGTVTPRAIAYPASVEDREVREGELLAPTNDFTVSNNYSLNQYAEIGLATGTTPLRQPTEYAEPSDTAGIAAIKDDNFARAVVLDDAQTINFLQNQANKAIPLPWLTPTNPVRVGAGVEFTGPVVLDWRNNNWKFQPTHPVTDGGADVATFEDTRAQNLVPQNVGGDLKIATFNVLNYFNTTGEAYVEAGPLQDPPLDTHCTYYTDRGPGPSQRITNNECGTRGPGIPSPNDGRGPRGAATDVSLARQEAKLAHTINALDADIIGLEEIENSIKLPGEHNRDDAVAHLVEILNAAGSTTWGYVKSPGEAVTAAAVAEQDVIRGAFIYQRDTVDPVGQSDLLLGTTQFANAREPLAQAFKAKGAPDSDAFAVIVNHFKSKGDNRSPAPPASGDNENDPDTGAFNGDRVRQAERLVQFAEDFAADRDIAAVFLAGDFNAYTMEEPIQVLESGGFELVESNDPKDETYSFSGLSGSLDHVLGNEAAMAMVTGADIWEINADESPAFQYSRYNYNVTDFWQPNLPFATSDHNPEIVGIDVPEFTETSYRKIQILGTNDFHGRLLPDGGNAAGAAPFATAVKELKAEVPDSIFVAAGDLVGASTFESFIQDDNPTIDALNAMDLEVSAAGNHEFDRGYDDFVGRIQDRATWEYIAANVNEPNGADELADTFVRTFGIGEDAIEVGFVGAVTEDLLALVNPALNEGVTVEDVVESTNAAAADLKTAGADLVVLLVHEGSPSTNCGSANFTDPATTWGNIVQNTSADVDAIISGHTHLAYNCRYAVSDWADEGRAVTKRPVVSAGQYGTNLNQLVFKFDEATGQLAAVSQEVIATAGVGYSPDTEVQAIVDDAVDFAEVAGSEVLGQMEGPFNRARYLPGGDSTENRGGESTLNNQVAEVQRWATDAAGIETDIAFMNPGGLRADMEGTANAELRDLTYREAADVQPFANTLVNMELTGAQIETVLEQQWQRNAQGGVPSRPFLRLGVSQGFTYTYEETPETVTVPNSAPVDTFRGEVTGMWLDGQPIDPTMTYSVTVNSFLGSGGDNFWELANGAGKVDTGKVDLEAMVDYMEQYDAANALPVDYSQHAVELTFPEASPEVYEGGEHVTVDVASWAMSAPGDAQDSQIDVQLGGESIGTATVDNTIGVLPYDDYGTAAVDVVLPADVRDGRTTLMLVGASTGTEIPVVVNTSDGLPDTTVSAPDQSMILGQPGSVPVTVTPDTATGTVSVRDGDTLLGSAPLDGGSADVTIPANSLPVGEHELTLVYPGSDAHSPSEGTVTMTVTSPTPPPGPSPVDTTTTASAGPMVYGSPGEVTVDVTSTEPTTGGVQLLGGDTVLSTGTADADGSATLTIPGTALAVGTHALTVRYLGDANTNPSQGTVQVTVSKADSSSQADVTPGKVVVRQGVSTVQASVTAPGFTPTGDVEVRVDGVAVATRTLEEGAAEVEIGPFETVGERSVSVVYLGDATTTGSESAASTIKVIKATPTMTVDKEKVRTRKGTTIKLDVLMSAPGQVVTGKVRVERKGKTWTDQLEGERAEFKLGPFKKPGLYGFTITYLGSDLAKKVTETVDVRVKRPRRG